MVTDNFKDQVAIVTGAGQGIGFGIAKALSMQGAKVLLNDEMEELAANAAMEIRNTGGVCESCAGDVADPFFIKYMTDLAIVKFGKLNIAIANAGVTLFGDFLSYSPEQFQRVMNVNMNGSFFLAQHAARQMKERNKKGSILFMSLVTGHQAHKNLAAYSMTKAAIEMLAKNLVIELSAYGITVNAIAPGATLTERTLNDADYKKTWAEITPMGRAAEVDDIVNAALFFVSPGSRHITGQSLVIDGGWTSVSPSPFK
jgi:NAD(P)-dependent dehydrogenase (short-subunit alcohol dehydrogenase family)